VANPTAIYFAPDDQPVPEVLRSWLSDQGLTMVTLRDAEQLMALTLRRRPRVIAMDARTTPAPCLTACRRMKGDSYTGVVPCIVLAGDTDEAFAAAFQAGADEVVRASVPTAELLTRLSVMLRRSDRDLFVHPSTRLPGAVEIELEVQRRLAAGVLFAMCYADLDHFKEFNDRYSYYDGDRVIRILAQILHDVVKGLCAEQGFVGHIGGDDFIFIIPVECVNEVCAEIIDVFDTLIPFQYSEQDRRAGYFFGKDRRGQLHRVPLMTLSIGVVTNERRHFTHAAQVSELATEMKSYAKTLQGSVYSVDRRQNPPVDAPPGTPGSALGRPRSAALPEGK
jgi:GGDEF domain-containing protein